jgi:hypothetical protein
MHGVASQMLWSSWLRHHIVLYQPTFCRKLSSPTKITGQIITSWTLKSQILHTISRLALKYLLIFDLLRLLRFGKWLLLLNKTYLSPQLLSKSISVIYLLCSMSEHTWRVFEKKVLSYFDRTERSYRIFQKIVLNIFVLSYQGGEMGGSCANSRIDQLLQNFSRKTWNKKTLLRQVSIEV